MDEENRLEPVQTRGVSCLFSSYHTFNWLNCNAEC